MCVLTTSPMLTMPARRPSTSTGRCLATGAVTVRVHFDGRWDLDVRPADAQLLPTGLDDVQAAFDAVLRGTQ